VYNLHTHLVFTTKYRPYQTAELGPEPGHPAWQDPPAGVNSACDGHTYCIPDGNPFVAPRSEMWTYGLRRPAGPATEAGLPRAAADALSRG